MSFTVHAACHCHTGRVRKNNEDNFLFGVLSLQERNAGLSTPLAMTFSTAERETLALFDGMGGENFGETASFRAARSLFTSLQDRSEENEETFSLEATRRMNQAVWDSARELGTSRMGATLAMLTFREDRVYACNLGDSRIFRLRQGKFHQLSLDHTDGEFLAAQGIHRRPHLTQHLGIDPEEMLIQPHVAPFRLQSGDWYVICSDGLTDMLEPKQIVELLWAADSPSHCAQLLLDAALEKGGRDNITVISCKVD